MNYNEIVKMTPAYDTIKNKEKAARQLVEKWDRTRLLDKLSESGKSIMSVMLENQAVALRKLNESSTVSDIAAFNKIAFPLVRRTFGRLLANEIVSVQPMNMPAGLLFYLDFVFERSKPGFAFGQGGSVYGERSAVSTSKLQGIGAQQATGGYYNLNSGYSKRMFLLSAAAPTYASVTANSAVVAGTLSGFNFTLVTPSSTDISQTRTIRPALSGEIQLEGGTFRSLTAMKSLTADSLSATIDPGLTQIISSSVIRVYSSTLLSAASSSATMLPVLVGPAIPKLDDLTYPGSYVGDFEAVSEIPQVNIQVRSVPVVAQTRKLKTVWTPELAQDLTAFHNLDPDVELTKVLSESIAVEIDNEILSDLLAGADVKAAWSRKNGRFLKVNSNGTVSVVNFADASNGTYQANFGTQREWYDTLIETINTVSNEIYKRNLRSGANWIVVSPEIASVIESMASFATEVVDDPMNSVYSIGIEKIGTLQSRYTVYKNPYFPADKILVGFRGDSFLETGYVYAPYVPLLITPTIFEPNDFTPRKAVMTRYAAQMVRPEYYGVITVFDLDVIGSPASI
jgi:hypothetical protein